MQKSEKTPHTVNQERSQRLLLLSKIIYELLTHEEDEEWLKLYKELTLVAKQILDKAENDLHPDLGLELNELAFFKLYAFSEVAKNSRKVNLHDSVIKDQEKYVKKLMEDRLHNADGKKSRN